MTQTQLIIDEIADQWLERNRDKLGVKDPVTALIQEANLQPQRILEIGSSNGWRLAKLRDIYKCEVYGLEPGLKSCQEAAEKNNVPTYRGTADSLPYQTSAFDLVIMGYCLWFCEPEHHFKIMAEADRVLADGGFLVVYDFACARAHKSKFPYDDRIFIYFMDPSKFWLVHPAYTAVGERFSSIHECVTLIRKDMANAFPEMKAPEQEKI